MTFEGEHRMMFSSLKKQNFDSTPRQGPQKGPLFKTGKLLPGSQLRKIPADLGPRRSYVNDTGA